MYSSEAEVCFPRLEHEIIYLESYSYLYQEHDILYQCIKYSNMELFKYDSHEIIMTSK